MTTVAGAEPTATMVLVVMAAGPVAPVAVGGSRWSWLALVKDPPTSPPNTTNAPVCGVQEAVDGGFLHHVREIAALAEQEAASGGLWGRDFHTV